MRFFALTLLLFIGVVFGQSAPAVRDEIIEIVNSVQSLWKASHNERFANMTVDQVQHMMGTILPGEENYMELPPKVFSTPSVSSTTSFDSREKWADCADLIGTARDQSSCGSCWAFSSTESLNDRICIKTGDTTLLSPADTLACCSGLSCGFSMGCNGGQPSGAYRFFQNEGVSTGGLYESSDSGTTCKPYPFPSCAHHVDNPDLESCDDLPNYSTPTCTSTCTSDSYGTSYSQDKHYAKSSYSVKGVSNIEQELMENGPVSAAFTVYEDFLTYESGIYQHVTGKSDGGHAVKIIGFGQENGVDYWTVVNSWNPSWGENGLFRILKGVDECGIESSIVAGEV